MEDIRLARIREFVKEIKVLSDDAKGLSNVTESNVSSGKIIKHKLASLLTRLSSELNHYFSISSDPDPDEISKFTTEQIQAEEMLAELDAKLSIFNERPVETSRVHETTGYSKLPDLKLPEFGGDLLEWHQFWDQFSSNIERRNLNDVDKLFYLKGSLKGEAARLLDGFDTTNRSYSIAVETLKLRYGKDDEIIYAHHRALSQVKRAEGIEDCRRTLDEVSRHLRVLQSMKENTNTNQIRYLIMEKFPTEVVYEIKMRSNETSSVEEVLRQLSIVITAKEEARRITQQTGLNEASRYTVETLHVKDTVNQNGRAKLFKGPYVRTPPQSNNKIREFERPLKRKFEYKNEANKPFSEGKRKRFECVFCRRGHRSVECEKIATAKERKAILAKLKRCFYCFLPGHRVKDCRRRVRCQVCEKGFHHRLLCTGIDHKRDDKSVKTAANVMHVNRRGSSTVLQTAVVPVRGTNTSGRYRILLDCGSQRSFLTRQVAKELNLQVEEVTRLTIFTFGTKKPEEIESPLVKVGIVTKSGTVKTLYANVVPSISQGVQCPDKELFDSDTRENYPLADDGSLLDRVDILLGNDYYYTIMCTRKVCIGENLYLVESELGWILSSNIPDRTVEQLTVLTYFQSHCEVRLNQPDPPLDNGNLKLLWDLESIGITDSPKSTFEEEAVHHFNKTVEFHDGRYQVKWPWTQYPPELPTNYGLALGRLKGLLRRSDDETLDAYNETLKDQLEAGVIEVVEPLIACKVPHTVHYLPHHMVKQSGKKGRIVYDASAKTKNEKSLNECLYRGPIMIGDLTGLILNFRVNRIAITADVEKAFLQVGLQVEDRDVTRFLWVKDTEKEVTNDNIIEYRFCRVPFGIISSPFILNATIKHHLSQSEKEKIRNLANFIYVDNVVTGTRDVNEALELYQDSKDTFKQISMNLREWSSNSKEFMQHIPDTCSDQVVKVLGLDWHLETDTLHLRTNKWANDDTKRGILKSVASIYDPCGYAVPTLLPAKLLLQDLWKEKLKWDTPLPSDIVKRWDEIKQDIHEIRKLSLPRCYWESNLHHCEIHCFTDSSMRDYAAVVYIVGANEISFVIGKSRLVPVKDQEHLKIPRLELLGVLIGSRLIQYVLKSINLIVTKQVMWTDSQIVIDWINSNKLLTPFVARRVEEIKRNKDLIFKHVPSNLNPADPATRPTSSEEERQKWLTGPDFLLKGPSTWLVEQVNDTALLVGEAPKDQEGSRGTLDINTNSNHQKENLEIQEIEYESAKPSSDSTLREIKRIQKEHFKEEVEGKETNLSRNLGLFKDVDGILRCKGRFKYAEWSFDKRYPIIIPKDCSFTNRLIRETHEKNYHVGANHTLSLIRQSYWIPQGKRQVSKILRTCPSCVKHGGGPFKLPPTPALPHERVNLSTPFTFTGIDYLGPVLVKSETGLSKRWICLFTCLAVRAVHLEVVQDLSAEEGLLALRRLISTRGIPALITSDNAAHFKLISEILTKPYCVENKIGWKFIPALAPWFGGFYERLVALVKSCMKRTLHKHLLKDRQLPTIVKEIEAVINSRPLTNVDTEIEHILKPADFLQAEGCLTMRTSDQEIISEDTSTKASLIQGWKRARVILREFEEMFRNRYLPSLRERYRHSHRQPRVTSSLTPREGQVVQIKGDKNREGWKVGKITSLIKSSDGLVRVAQVKVGDTLFTRSISQLYPLEVEDDEYYDTLPESSDSGERSDRLQTKDPSTFSIGEGSWATEYSNGVTKETHANDATRPLEDLPITNDSIDATRREIDQAIGNVEDSRDDPDNSEVGVDTTPEHNIPIEQSAEQIRPKRVAAVRALERIREWTRNLMVTLL